MNCGEVKDLIQLYLDDELDSRSTLSVQQHLEICTTCAVAFETLLRQDQLLQRAARAEPVDSSRVHAGILAAIQQQQPLQRPSSALSTSLGIWQGASQAVRRWWRVPAWQRLAAAVVLSLVATLAALQGGWLAGVNDAVYAAAAADHAAHCAANVMMMGDITDEQELKGVATAFAPLRAVPELASFGYGSPRGRLCNVNETEFLHLVYQHSSQPPLSLFIRAHAPSLIAARLKALQQDLYRVASLSQNGVDLIVVTSLDEAQTTAIAHSAAAQF